MSTLELEDDQKCTLKDLYANAYEVKKKTESLLTAAGQLKRKNTDKEYLPNKKSVRDTPDMLNGYRTEHHRDTGDSVAETPVAPLANMGNTCFLNSVIYSLRFAPTFLHNLHHLIDDLSKVNTRLSLNKAKSSSLGRTAGPISGPSSRSTSSKDLLSLGANDTVVTKHKVQIVTEKFHELFMTMHNLEEIRRKEPFDPFQPVAFLQAIRDANYIFEGNHQQDAHELLVYLLDNIRETCELLEQQIQTHPEIIAVEPTHHVNAPNSKLWNMKKPWSKTQKKKDKTKESISEDQPLTDAEDTNSVDSNCENAKKKMSLNFVAEDFEGVTLRRTKCLECECVTEIKEPFYDIPVPILNADDNFDRDPCEVFRRACVTMEKLCDTNKYLCDTCMHYNEASREVSFEKLPNIMVLQLKRFTTTASGVQKVNSYMPTPLEMSCFCDSCCRTPEDEETPHRYQLFSVIMHLGTLASGHYISYVRATDPCTDYADCPRDNTGKHLSSSGSEKSLNLLKLFKKENLKNDNSAKSGIGNVHQFVRYCNSQNCCGVKMNTNTVNGFVRRNLGGELWKDFRDIWLECDDENIRPVTSQELRDLLGYKPNSTSTPYLLFYSKVQQRVDDQQQLQQQQQPLVTYSEG